MGFKVLTSAMCVTLGAAFTVAPGHRFWGEKARVRATSAPTMSTIERAEADRLVDILPADNAINPLFVAPVIVCPDTMTPGEQWRLQQSIIDPEGKPEGWMPTRTDKLKAKYKGQLNSMDLEESRELYEQYAEYCAKLQYNYNVGDKVTGMVVQYQGTKAALVEIGAKSTALLPLRESTIHELPDGTTIADRVTIGESYTFQIIQDSRDDGQVVVSIRRMEYDAAWIRVTEMQVDDPLFEAPVVDVNRGGAICLVEGLRAFLPGSHMMVPGGANDDMVGKMLKLKFLEVNQEANKLVVSNRRAVIEAQMTEISRGDVLTGTVAAIKPYGAFIEVGGMSGLLHISQISYDRIEDLSQTLTMGMPIKCMIIDHDKVNGRIALSTKTLEPEPGDMLRNPQRVYDLAEETAAKYHERMEAERLAREQAAKEIVMGLADGLDGLDSLESVLGTDAPAEASE